ncbi:hypothetical protein R5W24_000869 [Gemmata sp. JC717]|uniref:hypothetical protein n=1 Tax=Gemmata algarum TaxID=2975278 RepID=UPI0021BBA808|nr:hypothetical protein [Gemmata algarum]MDY3551790.1 hypothetical protein [Gemmata algarum]
MSDEPRPTFLARVARRPLPVLLGLAVGFLGCCVAGRVAARQQPFKNFVRFHPGIAPESHYYPTYSQTLNLARQHVKPDTTLVLVCGNSVLYGVGQRPAHLWSKHLQEELGDDYVVLNMAMRGSHPNEFGGLIAEQLAADGVRLVVVTIGSEGGGWGGLWDGQFYRYFFWDAWGKGQLLPHPPRDRWLTDEFEAQYEYKGDDPAVRKVLDAQRREALEFRHRGRIDGVAYAADLWTYIADRYRGTVWTPMKYPKFWQPHRELADHEPGALVPWEAGHQPATVDPELRILRGQFQTGVGYNLLRGNYYREVGEQYKKFLPPSLEERVLFVLRMEGMYYRNKLPPDERKEYDEVFRRYRDAVRQAGLNVELVGERYEERDYADRSHLSESGGRKLATDLAPTIRAMNAKLYGPRP